MSFVKLSRLRRVRFRRERRYDDIAVSVELLARIGDEARVQRGVRGVDVLEIDVKPGLSALPYGTGDIRYERSPRRRIFEQRRRESA